MCGLIIEHLGWEAVFYITAGITLLWVVIWQVGRIPRRPDIVNVIYPAVHKSLWYFFTSLTLTASPRSGWSYGRWEGLSVSVWMSLSWVTSLLSRFPVGNSLIVAGQFFHPAGSLGQSEWHDDINSCSGKVNKCCAHPGFGVRDARGKQVYISQGERLHHWTQVPLL